MALRPFWTFFGGKWRLAPRYPIPQYSTIIEPFAGAAGYSLRYPDRNIILVEKDPLIAAIWKWLITVKQSDVMDLPRLPKSGRIDDVKWPCRAARDLAGFWITRGAAHPNNTASAWMRDDRYKKWSWGDFAIDRIAVQVDQIRHWRVIEDDYWRSPDVVGTWFVDPPYQRQGIRYRYGSLAIDYSKLRMFCTEFCRGQRIVCEQEGAAWMNFKPFYKAKANESVNGGKISSEVIWVSSCVWVDKVRKLGVGVMPKAPPKLEPKI